MKSPRAPKKKSKSKADQTDPPVDPFSEEFPWADSEMCDAYTSIEAKLFAWFEKEGLDLGRGAVLDLAVRMSACIEPFRSFYRATQGWDGYDLERCRQKAKLAEETL